MSFFKFFHGKSCDVPEPLPLPGIGLINDFYENGINTLGYEPYGMYKSGILFQSDICHRSYEEWRHLIDNNPGNVTYFLFAVLRPEDNYREQEVVYLDGHTDVFPMFVFQNTQREFLFEFIMIPNEYI
jgi:hypothetical protein